MEVEITAFDKHIDFPETIELVNGVTVTHRGTYIRKGAGFPDIVTLAVSVAKDVSVAIAAAAIYDFLKSRVKKERADTITIDRIEVDFEERAIKRIFAERITSERVDAGKDGDQRNSHENHLDDNQE